MQERKGGKENKGRDSLSGHLHYTKVAAADSVPLQTNVPSRLQPLDRQGHAMVQQSLGFLEMKYYQFMALIGPMIFGIWDI